MRDDDLDNDDNQLGRGQLRQEQVYHTLRRWLACGRFAPGERLKLRQLAEQLGVSPMPVRAALARLSAERALLAKPNCGVMVPVLSRDQFEEIFRLRVLLEGMAAEKAAMRVNHYQIAELEVLCDRMDEAVARGDGQTYLLVNESFHFALYQITSNDTLLQLIETLWMQVGPMFNLLFEVERRKHRNELTDPHREIIAALKRHDAYATRRALEHDIESAAVEIRPKLPSPARSKRQSRRLMPGNSEQH